MATNKHLMGFDGFIWFQGVVEDRLDPLKLGRVRVRCLGIHTEQLTFIPTESLPWAHVVMPVTSASMNGIGQSPTGLVDGTWVFGFFRDGDACQEPVVMGSLPGIPEERSRQDRGFYDQRTSSQLTKDPRKIEERKYNFDGSGAELIDEAQASSFPRVDHPLGCELDEPDTNRLARNDGALKSIIQTKLESRDLNVKTALGAGGTWSEPPSAYSAQYPYNHVRESESGHIEEWDDTPKCERVHRWHRTGTSEEIGPKGDKVERIVRDGYLIILRNDNIHICGRANVTVKGNINIYTESNLNIQVDKEALIYVKGDADVKVDGDVQLTVGGDVDAKITGDVAMGVDGNVSADIKKTLVAQVGEDTEIETQGDAKIYTHGDAWIKTDGNVEHTVGGTYKVTSGGNMTLTAPRIDLNP
jgi:hypothetical protein